MTPRLTLQPHTGPVVMSGTLPAETHADFSTCETLDLCGPWTFQFDFKDRGLREGWHRPDYRGVYQEIPVPGSWDTELLAGFHRQTVGWYRRTFRGPALPGRVYKLQFDGVFREATVWLNGALLGRQDVPYVPFAFDVSGLVLPEEENTVVVRIDDRIRLLTLPCSNIFTKQKHGWFPYGGITRPVSLQARFPFYAAQVRIDAGLDGTVHAEVLLEDRNSVLGQAAPPPSYSLRAWITDRDGDEVLLAWPERQLQAERSLCRLDGRLDAPRRWSPETPGHRYRLHLQLHDVLGEAEHVAYDFAFRTFEARDQRFYLNGQDHFLRGMNRHEDHPQHGPAYAKEAVEEEVRLVRALNVDFVRPGHYPVDVRVLKAFEDAGVMVAQEIPVYQLNTLQLAWPGLRRLARQALETMIIRDYNRPCVVMWSVCNEIHPWFPAASAFVRSLYRRATEMNPARPVMLARVTLPAPLTVLDVFDRVCGEVDVVGINQYVGWYFGKTHQARRVIERVHKRHPDRTWMISEYGADGLLGRHQDEPPGEEPVRDHSYTEEYQVYFHEQHIRQFLEMPFIRGIMPWVLADFRMEWSPNTGKPHPVRLMNLKGLVSHDRQPKKLFAYLAEVYRRLAPGADGGAWPQPEAEEAPAPVSTPAAPSERSE